MQDWELDQDKQVGSQIVRLDYWEASKADVTISKAFAKGLQVELGMGSLSYPAPISASSFGSRCGSMAAKYAGKIKYYEIMNEPDLHGWTPDTYVPYQKACHDAIKAANPNAVVWHAGMFDQNRSDTFLIDWMAREYALGAGKDFDAFNFHCYNDSALHGPWSIWDMTYGSGGAGYYDNYNVRSVMNSHGDSSKPIVCTEGGDGNGATNPTAQATAVNHALAAADGIGTGYRKTQQTFIYDMLNTVSGFGMMYQNSSGTVVAPDGTHWTKRPSWNTYYSFPKT
jgi:hypothetical protein